MARLGDVFDRQITGEWGNECTENENSTKILRTTNFTSDGNINYNDVVARSIREDKVIDKRLRYGDIILEKSGGTEKTPVGRVVFCDDSIEKDIYLCNNFTQAMRVRKNLAIPRYVFYFMWNLHYSGKTDLLQNKTTGIRNLQVKSYLNENIPLPPLDEQRKIAAVVDKVSDLIAKRRQQLDKLNTLVKARFVEMFGDLQINNKNWGVALVGENCFVTKLAGFEYTNYIHYQDAGDVVMVKAQNVKDGKLNNKELSYISSDVSNLLPRSQLAAGDIVMTYVGANIGDVALIDDKHRYHLAPNVAKISPDKEKYDSVFFMHMLMMLRTYISGNSADTAKAALSMERIRNLSVFIPPMNLQRIFASFAEQVEKLKSIVIQNFEQLEMIKKSLLQQYFG